MPKDLENQFANGAESSIISPTDITNKSYNWNSRIGVIMSSDLYQQLTAPNGVTYNQPLGLFINNEWHRSKGNEFIPVVSPM
jgi:hypothetical protein